MIPQNTPLYMRLVGGVYLVIGWEYDGGRQGHLDAVGVPLGVRVDKAARLGAGKLYVDLAEARKARP